MATKHFQNKARRAWWSVHVDAWRRSGLTRAAYCREHRLGQGTFRRWLVALDAAAALRNKERERCERRKRRLSADKRNQAVQAFWAMHVEAMTWCGMSVCDYADAHRLSPYSLRRWRDLIDAGEVAIDWRALLHPSARPQTSTSANDSAKDCAAESGLTTLPNADPATPERPTRRSFTAAEKRAVVLETERPGETVSSIARQHGLVTSVVFRWRAEFGYGRKERVTLAAVTLASEPSAGKPGTGSAAVVLHDVLPIPDGFAAIDLPDGRRVFAPTGSDPDTVRRHVAAREAAS